MKTLEKIQSTHTERKIKNLLSKGDTNAKTSKNELETFILYLAPHTQNSKGQNLCPNASNGCVQSCLYTAGMGKFSNVQSSRIAKANFYVEDKIGFLSQLWSELERINKKAIKQSKKIAVRLNGTSDLDFLALFIHKLGKNALDSFSNLVFYDYTKNLFRVKKYANESRYHLTFSRSEETQTEEILEALNNNANVSVVFSSDELPKFYANAEVIDGDKSDIEMIFGKGKILGLKAKGQAKKDKSGFVVQL
jgi:hypothetical protein